MYVIKRTDQGGGYVQQPGSHESYGQLETAQTFHTREDADLERCPGNEIAVRVSDIMPRPQ